MQSDLFSRFDAADYLTDAGRAEAYLEAAIEEGGANPSTRPLHRVPRRSLAERSDTDEVREICDISVLIVGAEERDVRALVNSPVVQIDVGAVLGGGEY